MPEEATEAALAVVTRIEEEVPRAVVVVRMRNGRPIEAERTGIVERSLVAVTGAGEKDTRRSKIVFTTNHITVNTVHGRPRPVAFIVEIVKLLFRRHAPIAAPMRMRRIMFWSKHTLRCYPAFTLQFRDAFV